MKRKLLAMVLSMAMTLSLGTFAANAASTYSDAADIQFDEAAAVLTAAGVFKGTGDGSFQPNLELDRASAAKIITYLSVGDVAAENMEAGEAPFYDVPANHWAAGYIAYCKNAGIIAGDGSGNFNPSAPVNASQFAKMLLVVLGYDADIELLVGANWSINVSKLAAKNGILDDVSDSIGSNLTRDVASKMSFNSLFSDTYEYQSKGDTIDLGNGQKIVLGASPVTTQSNKKHDYRNAKGTATDDLTDDVMQLAEKLFGEKLKKGTSVTDNMKRDSFEWQWDGKKVFTAYEDATLTYVADMSGDSSKKTLINDLKAKGVEFANEEFSNVNLTAYENGGDGLGYTTFEEIVDHTKAGMRTEIYIKDSGDKKDVKVCYTTYGVGEVVGVEKYTEGNGAEYTEYSIDGASSVIIYTKVVADEKNTGEVPSGLAEGDIVTFAEALDEDGELFTYVYATTKMTGIQTAYSESNETSTIGGQKYNWGTGIVEDLKQFMTNDSKQERTFYLDVNGFLVKVSEAESTDSYAVVTGIVKDGLSGQARATLVFTDGTSKTVDIASVKDKDGNNILADIKETVDDPINKLLKNIFFTYSVDSNGAYKLVTLEGVEYTDKDFDVEGSRVKTEVVEATDTEIIKKDDPTLALSNVSGTIGKSTKIIIKDDDGKISLYTGSANMPTVKTNEAGDAAEGEGEEAESPISVVVTGLYDLDADGDPKPVLNTLWIYIEKGAKTDDSSSNKEYAIFYKEGGDVTDVGGESVIVYQVGSDAQVKTINLDVDAHQDKPLGTLFQLTSVNSNGVVTEIEEVTGEDDEDIIVFAGKGKITADDGVLAFGEHSFNYNDDTVVTVADLDNNSVRKGNLDTIKSENITKVYVFKDEKKVEKVYVVYSKKAAEAAADGE